MKGISRERIREIDRRAIEDLGIAGVALMEKAGKAVAEAARGILKDRALSRCAIVCGMGNNGGDGFVAARHLKEASEAFFDLKVFALGSVEKITGDAAHHLEKLRGLPLLVEPVRSPEPLRRFAAAGPLLWIDAIFGTGLARPVGGLERESIELMNESGSPILAVDIPSGLDADTGEILGAAVQATATVTFVRPKLGFERAKGPEHCGQVIVAPIGIPEDFVARWAKLPG